MDYSQIQLFQMMKHKMAYHSERQDVLARNVVNSDTPGFRPSDIEEPNFIEELQKRERLQLRRTAPEHREGTFLQTPDFRHGKTGYFEIKPVDNAVSVEEQMMRISQNAFEFQTTTTLYNKTAGLFKTALGNR